MFLHYNIHNFVNYWELKVPAEIAENMKKIAVLLLVVVAVTGTYSAEPSWYKLFTGTIDSYPVTMSLVKFGEEVRGFYYYDKYKQPMDVYGNVKGDSITLYSYSGYDDSESFKGVLKGSSFSGIGDKPSQNKVFNFSLSADKKQSGYFEFVYVEGKERFFKDLESPFCNYTEGTIWPADEYANAQFIRNYILKSKNMKTGASEIGEQMLANKKKYLKDFREYNKDLNRNDMGDGWSYSLESQNINIPVFFNDKLFVISNFDYSFTGGAHGNYGTGFTNLDLKRKKVLTLDDVITKKGIEKLPALLEKYFKIQRGVPQEKSLQEAGLFLDTIPVNENFMISPGNIMFNYVPYEIASYADGEIKITIPYNEFADFVKPEVKDLFKD